MQRFATYKLKNYVYVLKQLTLNCLHVENNFFAAQLVNN